jgi:alkylated DNA repair dioxygenase AlkB
MSDSVRSMAKSSRAQEPPEGFRYETGIVPPAEERELAAGIAKLPLREFEFHGYTGKRRVISFGWKYEFEGETLREADPIPSMLIPLRDRAARFAGIEPEALAHVLVTEYAPGAAIGWHRDKAVFGDVVGISLLSPCVFRLRRKAGAGWERYSLTVEPRSAYLLRGPSRNHWEHSIRPPEGLRYAVTFRSLAGKGEPRQRT